jgi:hypothetical protein
MTTGAKIFISLAALCFLLWGIALTFGVQVLVPATTVEVIYGEHEDFYADGQVFHRPRDTSLVIVYLPRAEAGRQWWAVNFSDMAVSEVRPLRSLGGWRFLVKTDLDGPRIGARNAGAWRWHFTEDSASFANGPFLCRVRRTAAF